MTMADSNQQLEEQMAELLEKYKPMPLDEELVPFLEPDSWGQSLRHPLVYQVPYNPMFARQCNEQLVSKKDSIAECMQTGQYAAIIWFYEKPYRFEVFQQMVPLFMDDEYWGILGQIWTDSENLHQNQEHFKEVFFPEHLPWDTRRYMMTDEDARYLDQMPEELEVFRGYNTGNRLGWSWTFSPSRAWWFARRFADMQGTHEPAVVRGIIKKADVIAFMHEARGEAEIILDPDMLVSIHDYTDFTE